MNLDSFKLDELLLTGIDGLFIGRSALDIDHFYEIILSVANCDN